MSLNNMGIVAYSQGDYGTARTLSEEGLALRRELGNKEGTASSLLNLGDIACGQGEFKVARTLYGECLAIFRKLGDKEGIASSLEAFAALASEWEQPERAPRLWGAAETLR